jgi:predicted Rossmann fold flavoprotein
MAAIRAAQRSRDVLLLERNDAPGKKLLITGKGRCNVTNAAGLDDFIAAFGRQGRSLRTAFSAFFNAELTEFFKAQGVGLKTERQGRVFPDDDKAGSIVAALERALQAGGVKARYGFRLSALAKTDDGFELTSETGETIRSRAVILATGGASYRATGSTGDGFALAGKLGHDIAPLRGALVPLKTRERWVPDLQGLSLRNVRLTFTCAGKKRLVSPIGEMMFTHFGISGPLVLDLSGAVVDLVREHGPIPVTIDLKPGLSTEQIEGKLVREFAETRNVKLSNYLKTVLPERMIAVVLQTAGADGDRKTHQVSRAERLAIRQMLKALPVTVVGSLPVEHAMVTAGGVCWKEIDPRTMESRKVPGLYFAGEILDGCAASGGYNLQQAFSTGYLAGQSAADG